MWWQDAQRLTDPEISPFTRRSGHTHKQIKPVLLMYLGINHFYSPRLVLQIKKVPVYTGTFFFNTISVGYSDWPIWVELLITNFGAL